jgi:hypothetical protein
MGSATEANCDATTSSWWPAFLTNVGVTDGFAIANPIGNATMAILGTITLSVDLLLALPMGSPSLSPWVMLSKHKTTLQQSAKANRSTSTSSCMDTTGWTTWCSHVMRHHRSNHSSTWGFQEL